MVLLLPALRATAISRCLLEPATVRMVELLLLLLDDQLQQCGIRQSATNRGPSVLGACQACRSSIQLQHSPARVEAGWLCITALSGFRLVVYHSPVRVQAGCASLQLASSSCYRQI